MIRDAIVDEVRAIRDEIAKECGYDVHELFEAFRRLEAGSATDHVSFVPRSGAREPPNNAMQRTRRRLHPRLAADCQDVSQIHERGSFAPRVPARAQPGEPPSVWGQAAATRPLNGAGGGNGLAQVELTEQPLEIRACALGADTSPRGIGEARGVWQIDVVAVDARHRVHPRGPAAPRGSPAPSPRPPEHPTHAASTAPIAKSQSRMEKVFGGDVADAGRQELRPAWTNDNRVLMHTAYAGAWDKELRVSS